MFGIVNEALRDMLKRDYGDDTWYKIKARIGLSEPILRSVNYPDEITSNIIMALPDSIDTPIAQIQHNFGRFWYQYTQDAGYRELIDSTGNTFPEFLQNLNEMHSKVSLSFPGMKAPIFKCRDIKDNSLVLHYYSSREGFANIIPGALESIAQRFGVKVTTTSLQRTEDGFDHDIFLIKYK